MFAASSACKWVAGALLGAFLTAWGVEHYGFTAALGGAARGETRAES